MKNQNQEEMFLNSRAIITLTYYSPGDNKVNQYADETMLKDLMKQLEHRFPEIQHRYKYSSQKDVLSGQKDILSELGVANIILVYVPEGKKPNTKSVKVFEYAAKLKFIYPIYFSKINQAIEFIKSFDYDKYVKCDQCTLNLPMHKSFFPKNKRVKTGLSTACKTCSARIKEVHQKTKDCKNTWNKFIESDPGFSNNVGYDIDNIVFLKAWTFFYARRYFLRLYREMIRYCTDKNHWNYENCGAKGARNLFENFDEFFGYFFHDCEYDYEAVLPDDPKLYRFLSKGNFKIGNIRLCSTRKYYTSMAAYMTICKDIKLLSWAACARCKQKFPQDLENFPPNTQTSSGFQSICRSCTHKADKQRQQDPECKTRRKRYWRKKGSQETIEDHLFKLFNWCKPINKNFLFRLPGKLILFKFLNAGEFVEHTIEILDGRDPRELRLDLIDYDKNIEKNNLEFLTEVDYVAKHKGAN